jgi:hypothetical protein
MFDPPHPQSDDAARQEYGKGFCLWFFKETQERKKLMSCQPNIA